MNLVESAINAAATVLQAKQNLPDEAKRTLPFIVYRNGIYFIAFGYYLGEPGLVKGRPRKISFPFVQIFVNSSTFEIKYENINAMNFGVSDTKSYVGDLGHLQGIDVNEYSLLEDSLTQAISKIISLDYMNERHALRGDEVQIARQCRYVISRLREKSLDRYYTYYSKQFDEWLARMAK